MPHRLICDRPTERRARDQSLTHLFERVLGNADRTHAVMNAAWTESSLCDLETASFAEQYIADRHAHVVQRDFCMTVWCVVVAEHMQRALDGHTLRVCRHENHRLLLMLRGVGVRLAHH